MPFDLNNLGDFKQISHNISVLVIKFVNNKFISYDENDKPSCRAWSYMTYYTLDPVNSEVYARNNAEFVRCGTFNEFSNEDGHTSKVIHEPIFDVSVISKLITNTICFFLNITMLGLFVDVLINFQKLNSLKREKHHKMKWLNRNGNGGRYSQYMTVQSNFDYNAKLDEENETPEGESA